jgi:guanylate kinase
VQEKQIGKNEEMEKITNVGLLLVISGASGAGKDTVMAKLLEHPQIVALNLRKIVTCTDRPPRPGETDGIDYHFLTSKRLLEMDKSGKLVEEITLTGSSRKATPKSEIERLLTGENLIWRIDPSRAAEVASGNFFTKHFPKHSQILQERTIVLCITAPKEVIEARRKHRDEAKYNPNEYKARDEQEAPHLSVLAKKAVLIESVEGKLDEIVETATKIVVDHHTKIKNEK